MNSDEITSIEQWRHLLGDPTGIGWIITISYLLTFILCLWAGISVHKHKQQEDLYGNGGVLIGVSVFLLLLGINKQLDLQTLLTIIGRNLAKSQGWYNLRRLFQLVFIVLFILIVLLLLSIWIRRMKGKWRQYGFHFVGTIFILLFVMIRATSIEHVSFRHAAQYDSVSYILISLFELVGILIVGLGSVLCLHRINVSKHRHYKFDWE